MGAAAVEVLTFVDTSGPLNVSVAAGEDADRPKGPCVPAVMAGSRTRINADIPSTGASGASPTDASPPATPVFAVSASEVAALALSVGDRWTNVAGGAGPLGRSSDGGESGTLCSPGISRAGDTTEGAVDDRPGDAAGGDVGAEISGAPNPGEREDMAEGEGDDADRWTAGTTGPSGVDGLSDPAD